MTLSIISFTEEGIRLSVKTAAVMHGMECALYTKCSRTVEEADGVSFFPGKTGEWAGGQMQHGNALLFIGACGIAVRAIAPYITDKLHDSPVLVMDEKGKYVIPILSGHMGGANELARTLARALGAEPVITTATDINNKFAIDLFAGKNELTIVNKDGIARVSAKVLAGEKIIVSVEPGHLDKKGKLPENVEIEEYPPLQKADVVITSEEKRPEAAIWLRPKEYVIGIGCRKGKAEKEIEEFIKKHLDGAGISPEQIAVLSSIDVKKAEPGLLVWSRKNNVTFLTYTADELMQVEGNFHSSEFVRRQVGADNVCERAALMACGPDGEIVYEKHAENGMTMAIARRKWRVSFDET